MGDVTTIYPENVTTLKDVFDFWKRYHVQRVGSTMYINNQFVEDFKLVNEQTLPVY